MAMPTIDSRSLDCGKTTEIEAFDKNGNPVTYRISARPPGPVAGSSHRSDQDAGDTSDGRTRLPLTPRIGGSFEALIVGPDLRPDPAELDNVSVLFSQNVLPRAVVLGERLDIHVIKLAQVRANRVVFDLPTGLHHEDGTALTLMLGLD